MGRRTILLIAALVIAALGTVLIFVYVKSADDRAQAGTTPVQVLVATEQVPVGTTAAEASNEGWFETLTVPESARADGALTDVSIISDQIALAPIYAGQQIQAQMFGPEGSTSGLEVPKGKLAISVQLGDPERVAGFVVPGSEVAIFATLSGQTVASQSVDVTAALLPEVEVIGVGATTLTTQTTTTDEGESTTEEIPLAILTLAVDQREAQAVINAQSSGTLYFGLLGDETRVRTGSATTTQNLFR